MATSPAADSRIAVLLPERYAAVEPLLAALGAAGYRTADTTESLEAESLSFAEYAIVFATLPLAMQQAIAACWGPGERDPLFRPGRLDCGRFVIPGFRSGHVAVVTPPAFSGDTPPHGHVAALIWIADAFRADAILDLTAGGSDAAQAVLGRLPRLDPTPFI